MGIRKTYTTSATKKKKLEYINIILGYSLRTLQLQNFCNTLFFCSLTKNI